MKSQMPQATKNAYILTIIILGITLFCLIWIFTTGASAKKTTESPTTHKHLIGDIYQNGTLIESISLDAVTESYSFTITGENNCTNQIEVRPGCIGIISASCPDKLCVHQGFIDSGLLPITCLPNRLVIQIRTENTTADSFSPDITTY